MAHITLLDGGMGQELLRRSAREVSPLWSADIMLNEPQLVRDLHSDFIAAGARVITLNTYTATPPRLKREHQLNELQKLHDLANQAALTAVAQSGHSNVRIAACLPPLVASYHPEMSLSYAESLSYYRQLAELQNPASDLFICETMSSILEASAASAAALETGKPVWIALSVCDDNQQLLRSGETLKSAIEELDTLGVEAIVLNCSQPEAITHSWPVLKKSAKQIGAYANGFTSIEELYPGDTVEVLNARKDLGPQEYAKHAMKWVQNGASIIGGCCEIGPLHIKALRDALIQAGYCCD